MLTTICTVDDDISESYASPPTPLTHLSLKPTSLLLPKARRTVGTPCYVYDLASLASNADTALSFPNAYGLTARFAMKASPNKAILQLFDAKVHQLKNDRGGRGGGGGARVGR